MKVLAIDTSVGVSVAILDDKNVLAQFTDIAHGIQGELTAAKISQLMAQTSLSPNQIETVVVGVGPGPFTGLRVGLATAQAFSFALEIPIFGICSLDAVAFEYGKPCVVVTDARRKELYWARYEKNRITGPEVAKPEQLAESHLDCTFVGPAVNLYPEFITGEPVALTAGALGQLYAQGQGQLLPVTPMYLRKPDAQESTSRKSVL